MAADFNNDGSVDLFIPYYSFNSASEHSYLLINDGAGHFTDVADTAGVALRNVPAGIRPEGAQAIDFNMDGLIDLYVAGHLFINNGDLTFTDIAPNTGLPTLFDEGAKFLDWNNDGNLDLLIHNPTLGPSVYTFDGQQFFKSDIVPTLTYGGSFGANVYDLNNDGFEDIVLAGGNIFDTVVLLNNGSAFERATGTGIDAWGNDCLAFADVDKDGRIDILKRDLKPSQPPRPVKLHHARNQTRIPAMSQITLEIVGENGEHNQFGRVVKIEPRSRPDIVMTRVVDGGSGYLSQGQYELLVGTPFPGVHDVEVYFPGRIVTFSIDPAQAKRVYPSGRVQEE